MEKTTKAKSTTRKRKAPQKKKAPVQATPVEVPEVTNSDTPTTTSSRSVNEVLTNIKNKMKITKVTATRCVKTKRGDHFVAFSSHWDSVRDDSEEVEDSTDSAMTLEEANIALAILQFKADTACIEAAYLGGDISASDRDIEIRNLRVRYSKHLKELADA